MPQLLQRKFACGGTNRPNGERATFPAHETAQLCCEQQYLVYKIQRALAVSHHYIYF